MISILVLPPVAVSGPAVNRIARVQCVSPGPIGASADCYVSSRAAHCAGSALLAGARVLASEFYAGLAIRTLAVREALAPLAADQRVADVPGGAGAHWPLLPRVVVPWCADRACAAGVRVADITSVEHATEERIAGHVTGTAADRSDAPQVAVGIHSAHPVAGVYALLVEAGGLVPRAVGVRGALWSTGHQSVAQPILRTAAYGLVVDDLALRVGAARAGALAPEGAHAGQVAGALGVALAFVAAAG